MRCQNIESCIFVIKVAVALKKYDVNVLLQTTHVHAQFFFEIMMMTECLSLLIKGEITHFSDSIGFLWELEPMISQIINESSRSFLAMPLCGYLAISVTTGLMSATLMCLFSNFLSRAKLWCPVSSMSTRVISFF